MRTEQLVVILLSLIILIGCSKQQAVKPMLEESRALTSTLSEDRIGENAEKLKAFANWVKGLKGVHEFRNFPPVASSTAESHFASPKKMGSDFVISLFCFCAPGPHSFPTNYMIKCAGKRTLGFLAITADCPKSGGQSIPNHLSLCSPSELARSGSSG